MRFLLEQLHIIIVALVNRSINRSETWLANQVAAAWPALSSGLRLKYTLRLARAETCDTTDGLRSLGENVGDELVLLQAVGGCRRHGREVSSAPAVVPECHGAVELDERVPVCEAYVCGNPEKVVRMIVEVRGDLDHLREEDPGQHGCDQDGVMRRLGVETGASEGPGEGQS